MINVFIMVLVLYLGFIFDDFEDLKFQGLGFKGIEWFVNGDIKGIGNFNFGKGKDVGFNDYFVQYQIYQEKFFYYSFEVN